MNYTIRKVSKEEINNLEPPAQDGYDGYYDDRLPSDNHIVRQTIDSELIKRILIILAGVTVIIGGCIALLYFMK